MINNSCETKSKGPRKTKKISISQEVYIDYTELLNILSDPLNNSEYELALAEQPIEVYKDFDASGNADSYCILCQHITTLQAYINYKNELYDHPSFVQKCETFDITVKPTTDFDILAVLREHPLAGTIEWKLFDEVLYCSFLFLYHNKQQNDRDLAQFVEARRKALARLQTISEYTSSASVHPKIQKSIHSPETTDFSETSSACPSKMGKGEMGLPIVPFPRCCYGPKITESEYKQE